jgi:hypothetical protein
MGAIHNANGAYDLLALISFGGGLLGRSRKQDGEQRFEVAATVKDQPFGLRAPPQLCELETGRFTCVSPNVGAYAAARQR